VRPATPDARARTLAYGPTRTHPRNDHQDPEHSGRRQRATADPFTNHPRPPAPAIDAARRRSDRLRHRPRGHKQFASMLIDISAQLTSVVTATQAHTSAQRCIFGALRRGSATEPALLLCHSSSIDSKKDGSRYEPSSSCQDGGPETTKLFALFPIKKRSADSNSPPILLMTASRSE
jgi:hypothetical protein